MAEWWRSLTQEWWNTLTALNKCFYGAAAFFSIFFLWQMLAALIGWGGEEGEADVVEEVDEVEVVDQDVEAGSAEAATSFRLFSIRAMITFFTLFTWGGALYLDQDVPLAAAIGYSVMWGLAGMFAVALIIWGLRKLTKSETSDLKTCVGRTGTVYLDIPKEGPGEVRVSVSGAVSYVKARSVEGKRLKAGTRVRVVRQLDQTTVEVEPVEQEE